MGGGIWKANELGSDPSGRGTMAAGASSHRSFLLTRLLLPPPIRRRSLKCVFSGGKEKNPQIFPSFVSPLKKLFHTEIPKLGLGTSGMVRLIRVWRRPRDHGEI